MAIVHKEPNFYERIRNILFKNYMPRMIISLRGNVFCFPAYKTKIILLKQILEF